MYLPETDICFNGVHWNKWDIEIKKLAKFYNHSTLLEGIKNLNIHPRFALPRELNELINFCEKETQILY